MRYKFFPESPPEGFDAPDPDIIEAINTLLNAPDEWFLIKNFDADLEDALEDLCVENDTIGFDVFPDEEDDGAAYIKYVPHPVAEPVSDD